MQVQIIEEQKAGLRIKKDGLINDLRAKYQELGEFIAAGSESLEMNPDSDMEKLIGVLDQDEFFKKMSEITRIKEEIIETDAKIEELESVKVCPKCGSVVAEDELFCAFCGERLMRKETSEDESVCPQCGKPRKAEAAFCVYCGFHFEEVKEENTQPQERRCVGCGEILAEDVVFCHMCGLKQP